MSNGAFSSAKHAPGLDQGWRPVRARNTRQNKSPEGFQAGQARQNKYLASGTGRDMAGGPNTQVMLLGGLYHASSQSFSSEEALAYLRKIGINKAFISAGGVHPTRGVSCSNFHEVAVKQAAIAGAMESILVVDESKLGS